MKSIENLLDGTEKGKLRVRVFTFLNERKAKYEDNLQQASINVSDVFKLPANESDELCSEWLDFIN